LHELLDISSAPGQGKILRRVERMIFEETFVVKKKLGTAGFFRNFLHYVFRRPNYACASDISWYGNGNATSFYISNADELAGLAQLVNDKTDNFSGDTITLTADINLSGYSNWTPIGRQNGNQFCGIFDGNGNTIFDMTIDCQIRIMLVSLENLTETI
jgi:hypothetical protein